MEAKGEATREAWDERRKPWVRGCGNLKAKRVPGERRCMHDISQEIRVWKKRKNESVLPASITQRRSSSLALSICV